MPSQYTGVATATQDPSPAPGIAVAPILNLPTAGDTLTVSGILQGFKTLADWSAWASTKFAALHGITLWTSTATYAAGDTVVDPTMHRIYLALGPSTNQQPMSSPIYWAQMDYNAADIRNMTVLMYSTIVLPVCSHGATVPFVDMLVYNGGAKSQIMFRVDNAPVNDYTDIDLNGCATKFTTIARTGQVTLAQSGSTSIGQLGISVNSGGDKNVVRLMCNANFVLKSSSYGADYSAFVTLWGT